MEEIPSFWNIDTSSLDSVVSPKSVLQKQASELSKLSKGKLLGVVRTQQNRQRDGFIQEFYIEVPLLDNYRYNLLDVIHSITMFPATIRLYSPAGGQDDTETDDLSGFMEALKRILTSKDTNNLLAGLLAQVDYEVPTHSGVPSEDAFPPEEDLPF